MARNRYGLGQKVESSIYGAQLAFQPMHLAGALHDSPAAPLGSGTPLINYDGPCRDGKWVNFSVVNAAAWPNLCRALSLDALETDPRFATPEARRENMAELVQRFDRILDTKPASDWIERLRAEDVICAPVQDYDMIRDDPQAWDNGYIANVRHPRFGEVTVPGVPVRFSDTPASPQAAAPSLGEHTMEILSRIGYDEAEIAAFGERGVI